MIDEANSVFGHSDCLVRRFTCMGSPCEVLIDSPSESLGQILFNKIHNEAKRIEDKYSRYKTHNIVFEINNANGKKIRIDKETERLLKFADKLYYVSGGLFDITSGVLRKAWKFEGQEFEPDQNLISGLLNKVGWSRVKLQGDRLQMPPGAEIDFGGVVKEYAVDCCVGLARNNLEISVLVNFGGDIAVSGPKRNGQYWNIKIDGSDWEIKLGSGAVATSGDKHHRHQTDDCRTMPQVKIGENDDFAGNMTGRISLWLQSLR